MLILRHGKPAAAIVPVELATPAVKRPPKISLPQVTASVLGFVAEFSAVDPNTSAVDDLLKSRR